MAKKKSTAEPDAAPTAQLDDSAGLTITFPAPVRQELLGLGQGLGLGIRATQDLVAAYYADPEHGPARAAELQKHLRLPLTRFRHEQELGELKARQEQVEAAQKALESES